VCSWCRSSLSQRPLRTRDCHLRSSAFAIWFHAPGLQLQLDKEVSQSTDQPLEPSATSTTGPVGERLQADTEDAPVLDSPAPLRRLHDSGAAYSDLLTDLLTRKKVRIMQCANAISMSPEDSLKMSFHWAVGPTQVTLTVEPTVSTLTSTSAWS